MAQENAVRSVGLILGAALRALAVRERGRWIHRRGGATGASGRKTRTMPLLFTSYTLIVIINWPPVVAI